MRWRLSNSEFKGLTKADRVAALERLVRSGTPVGILGYSDGEPVAWCSAAPRRTYTAIERSRTIPRVDDTPVWSIACFFVAPRVRKQGIVHESAGAAVEYARSQGAPAIEAYPWPGGPSYLYMGTTSTFLRAGFREAVPPGPRNRRVMRYDF